MAALPVISLSVGINEPSGGSEAALQFAESDAREFHRYARDDAPLERHEVLTGDGVTRDNIHAAVQRLAALGDAELALVFLSGHAERGRFLTAEAGGLDATELDALLHQLRARNVLLFVDACYAAALVDGMRFFTHLDDARTRLFLCSSRADQKSWEDEEWHESFFVRAMFRALGSAGGGSGVDVERELFPVVRAEVPPAVYHAKNGAAQEPVAGGVSSSALTLRRGHRFVSEQTPLGIVRRRVRRTMLIVGAIAGATLLTAQCSLYHFLQGRERSVAVGYGIKQLDPLLPRFFRARHETSFNTRDDLDEEKLTEFSDGAIEGVWGQSDPDGLPAWTSKLTPFLTSDAQARWNLLLGRRVGAEADPLLAARTVLLAGTLPSRALVDGAAEKLTNEYGCGPTAPGEAGEFAIFLVNLPHAEVMSRLRSLAASARTGSPEVFRHVRNAITAVSYRSWHIDAKDAVEEGVAAADIVDGIAAARLARGKPPLPPELRRDLELMHYSGCSLQSSLALARVGGSYVYFPTHASARPAHRQLAFRGLTDLARTGELSERHLQEIAERDLTPELLQFLGDVGELVTLPDAVVERLLAEGTLETLLPVARAAPRLDEALRAQLGMAIARLDGGALFLRREYLELISYAAPHYPIRDEVQSRLRALTPPPPDEDDELRPIRLRAGQSDWHEAVPYARLVRKLWQSSNDAERTLLPYALADPPTPNDGLEIRRALLALRERRPVSRNDTADILRDERLPRMRALKTQLVIDQIAAAPAEQRIIETREWEKLWREEREPVARMAFGGIVLELRESVSVADMKRTRNATGKPFVYVDIDFEEE